MTPGLKRRACSLQQVPFLSKRTWHPKNSGSGLLGLQCLQDLKSRPQLMEPPGHPAWYPVPPASVAVRSSKSSPQSFSLSCHVGSPKEDKTWLLEKNGEENIFDFSSHDLSHDHSRNSTPRPAKLGTMNCSSNNSWMQLQRANNSYSSDIHGVSKRIENDRSFEHPNQLTSRISVSGVVNNVGFSNPVASLKIFSRLVGVQPLSKHIRGKYQKLSL